MFSARLVMARPSSSSDLCTIDRRLGVDIRQATRDRSSGPGGTRATRRDTHGYRVVCASVRGAAERGAERSREVWFVCVIHNLVLGPSRNEQECAVLRTMWYSGVIYANVVLRTY